MRRFSDTSGAQFMSETTDGQYVLYSEAQAEIERWRTELIGELRSEKALANAYCANGTRRYCESRLAEIEAAARLEETP